MNWIDETAADRLRAYHEANRRWPLPLSGSREMKTQKTEPLKHEDHPECPYCGKIKRGHRRLYEETLCAQCDRDGIDIGE